MPPTLFVVLAVPFYKLAHTVFYWDWYVATAVFCGGIFGYTLYDCTHYFIHHKKYVSTLCSSLALTELFSRLPFDYFQQLRSYHIAHHWKDHENGFGVTSRFWDRIFGTELAMPNMPNMPNMPKAVKAS